MSTKIRKSSPLIVPRKPKKFKLPPLEPLVDALLPNQLVDRRYMKDGQPYWVHGYRIADLAREIPTFKGCTTLKLKDRQKPRLGEVLVVSEDCTRPLRVRAVDVRSHNPKDSISFSDLFGASRGAAIVLRDVQRSEEEDLSLGVGFVVDDDV